MSLDPRIHCEVPVQHRAASGAEVNGVIDLIAEGPAGRLVLDHKSGGGIYEDYMNQLELYIRTLGTDSPRRTAAAIHWIDRTAAETSIEVAVLTGDRFTLPGSSDRDESDDI
jgi:ATP-dependent helicase/nuclease subunit A